MSGLLDMELHPEPCKLPEATSRTCVRVLTEVHSLKFNYLYLVSIAVSFLGYKYQLGRTQTGTTIYGVSGKP